MVPAMALRVLIGGGYGTFGGPALSNC